MRFIPLVGLFLVLVFLSASSLAHAPFRHPRLSMDLIDASGAGLPTFHHRGKVFVLGRPGQRYSIVLSNRFSRRAEAVVSVDGKDIVSGRWANRRDRGYLVPAFGRVVIDGFRLNRREVATFRFARRHAKRWSGRGVVGEVRARFFLERERRRTWRRKHRSHRKPSSARPDWGRLETDFGEERFQSVTSVPFLRSRRAPIVVRLGYDDRRGLISRGVIKKRSKRRRKWRRFKDEVHVF